MMGLYSHMIARRGAEAIPFLKKTLHESSGKNEIYDVVEVLWSMQKEGTYNVHEDAELMEMLSVGIAKMKDGVWKSLATNNLEDIRKPVQSLEK